MSCLLEHSERIILVQIYLLLSAFKAGSSLFAQKLYYIHRENAIISPIHKRYHKAHTHTQNYISQGHLNRLLFGFWHKLDKWRNKSVLVCIQTDGGDTKRMISFLRNYVTQNPSFRTNFIMFHSIWCYFIREQS